MRSPEMNEVREQYFQEVLTAIAAYLKEVGGMTLSSERSDNHLTIAIQLDDADAYHAILERMTRSSAD